MKVFALVLLVFCAAAFVEGSPARKTEFADCDLFCSADYSPVCAAAPNGKPRLFGNNCALLKHNCEHKSNLVKVNQDLCKNVGGVRLS